MAQATKQAAEHILFRPAPPDPFARTSPVASAAPVVVNRFVLGQMRKHLDAESAVQVVTDALSQENDAACWSDN